MVWNGKTLTFFITGASSGFGLELTRLAVAHSHRVIATCRSPSTSPSLTTLQSPNLRILPLDITDATASRNLIAQLEDEGEEIDVLLNCAGFSIHGPAESFTEEEVLSQMEIGFFAPYRLIRAVVPGMRKRRKGMVVCLSSGAGVDGRESMAIYGASKAAMDGLLRVAAKEFATFDIRTLSVVLGGFDTNFAGRITTTETPFPSDYDGSMVEKVIGSIGGGAFVPDGDHRKACRAIYDVIMGEAVGEGREDQRLLPLGRDMAKSLEGAIAKERGALDVFGDICNNVYLAK